MNATTRGIRNAFRNQIRTLSIVLILGLSIGLTLIMLIAHQTVNQKINSVKSSVGNTITIAPAGFSGFSDVNNALTTSELSKVSSIAHVTGLTETLSGRVTTIGSSQPNFGFGNQSSSNSNATTSLTSPVKINSGSGNGPRFFINGGSGSLPSNFSPPIEVLGTTNPTELNNATGNTVTLKSGSMINGTKDSNDAMISSSMASKNSLGVGSTFTAYGATLTVAGIFNSSTNGSENIIVMSLPTLQRLSGQTGDVSGATATVDSLDNLAGATTAVKNTLGSSADVQSSQDQANNTVKPLENVSSISMISLIGAMIAGAIIVLLTMIMIVRERRREIGILKAIGASNLKVVFQFMSEALTLTILAAIIGLIIGVAGSSPVTNTLVNNSTSSSTSSTSGPSGSVSISRFGANGSRPVTFRRTSGGFLGRNAGSLRNSITNLHASVGWSILAYGLGVAILIAIIGSGSAGWLIAKVRPAEVMRVE